MLTPRLLIVGMFAVALSWFPGILGADDLRPQLPESYTLDLFSELPGSQTGTPHADPKKPKVLDFRVAGTGTYGDPQQFFWEPVYVNEFGAGGVVPTQYQAAVAGLKNISKKLCDDCCPLCQGTLPKASDPVDFVPEEPAEVRLREGEPAKVLLQTMKQVRPSILDGTIFQESRPIHESDAMPLEGAASQAIMVRCIRNLEAQAEHHRAPQGTASLSSSTAPTNPYAPTESTATTPDAVAALRQAGRDLEATANMLEERGLYDQADHLRAVAQEMRIQARATTASSHPNVSYAPTPMPGPGADGDELAGDENRDERDPKLRYDGDCEDHD